MLKRLRKISSGFRFRLLALIGAFGLALFVVLQIVDTTVELRQARIERGNDARTLATVAARSLRDIFVSRDYTHARSILAAIRQNEEVTRVSVVDRELTFMSDERTTRSAPIPVSSHSEMQMKSLKTGQAEMGIGPDGIEVAEPIIADGKVLGSAAVWVRQPGLFRIALAVAVSNLTAIVPVMAAAMVLALLLGRQVSRPLRKLRGAVVKFANGDLNQRVEVEGVDEVSELGAAFRELSEKLKTNIEQVHELAYVDRITQLPNREYFKREVNRAIKRAARASTSGAVLFVDLDGFKKVNDTMGHEVGDHLLKLFSDRVAKVVRANDMISLDARKQKPDGDVSTDRQVFARLGGDEFTVLLDEIREETDAANVARRIIAATGEHFEVDGAEVMLGASVGIATFPRDGSDYQAIVKSADMAMYQAKEEGKNTYRFYSEELNHHAARRLEIESDLRRALAREELELYFQPIVDIRTGVPVAAEALVRWNHPTKGVLDPGEFIRIAEKSGLVLPLGLWVLNAACDHLHEIREAGFDLSVAVNVARQQFEQPDFAQRVLGIVETSGVKADRLQLEIPEETLMGDPRRTLDHFRRLKRAGIRIAVDDFGTGRSSLSHLGRLRLDIAKIDRTFVELLTDEANDQGRRTVRAIMALADSLGIETTGVGVETEAQRKFLADAGCNLVQGYLYGQALPAGDFIQWLIDNAPDNRAALRYKEAPAA